MRKYNRSVQIQQHHHKVKEKAIIMFQATVKINHPNKKKEKEFNSI